MANGSMGILLFGTVVIVGVILLYAKGCENGIQAICKLRNRSSGGGSGSTPEDIEDLANAGVIPTGSEATTGGFERVRLSEAMERIANQAVKDIDNNTFRELGREKLFELKAILFNHYQDHLEKTAEYNDVTLKPLTGRALAKYSSMVLDVSRRMGIFLNPAYESILRANLFAGTPLISNPTANMGIIVA